VRKLIVAAQMIGRRCIERSQRVITFDYVVGEAPLPGPADDKRAVPL
jgi:hypothetical protein